MISRSSMMILLLAISCHASAECVEGARTKSKFSRLNTHTVALTGGYGEAIVIKTSCTIKRKSDVAIIKDSFCDLDKAVLTVDGQDCDAEKVALGDKFSESGLNDGDNWDYTVD